MAVVAGLLGCSRDDGIVIVIRGPANVALSEYAVTVQDRDTRSVVFRTGVQPFSVFASARDLSEKPLRIGLFPVVNGRRYLVHARASADKLAPDAVVAPNPRTLEYFFATFVLIKGTEEINADLLPVGPGFDRDFDHFPDAVPWMAELPEARMRYDNQLELLDCIDRDPAPGEPALPVPYYAGQINPLAKPACGLAIDLSCEARVPVCEDRDGDGEAENTDCDDSDPTRFHNNPRPRNCCQCNDRLSCATNHNKLTDLSACQPARCDNTFDYDCTGQTVPCAVDEDCDGFSPNDAIVSLRDCDDMNPDVHPGAAKNCADSSHDWACDGAPTAGCTPCDLDGDGYQRSDAPNGCPTSGYTKPFDCDDNDRGVFPGSTAFEGVSLIIRNLPGAGNQQEGGGYIAMALRGTCRNRVPAYPTFQTTLINQDADCDGNARNGCPTAACDVDGDGFPNAGGGCNPTSLPIDCNDGNAQIFPGAPEKCGDGIAQGCSADAPCANDADADGYSATYDCNDNNANSHPWATELCDGVDNDCDGLIDEGNPDLTGAPLTKTYSGSLQGIRDCADDNDGECGRRNPQQALSGRCVCTGALPTGIVDVANRTACPGNVSGNTIGPKCFGATQPKLQTCIASQPRDEDCNGSSDAPTGTNLVEAGQACGNNTGECKAGTVTGCRRTGYINPFYVGAGTPPVPVSPAFDPERRFLVCGGNVRPPAVETCDSKDNDCNAVADQTCTEIAGATTPACCLVSMAPLCTDLSTNFNFCGTCTKQCNAATADRCSTGACKCGIANACTGTTPLCKTGGTCVQCLISGDCGAAAPICNPAGNNCRVCMDDSECVNLDVTKPVCDGSGQCVECRASADCSADAGKPICDAPLKACRSCANNAECIAKNPMFPTCNAGNGSCM